MPGSNQLSAALLTQQQVGVEFTVEPSSGSGGDQVTGCPQLTTVLDAQGTPRGGSQANITYDAENSASVKAVAEGLFAQPASQMTTTYSQLSGALAACRELGLPGANGETTTLTLSPIEFAAGATAARIDGPVSGVQLNGYLALDRVRPTTAMIYLFLQSGSGSSQQAFDLFQKAIQQAQQQLPG